MAESGIVKVEVYIYSANWRRGSSEDLSFKKGRVPDGMDFDVRLFRRGIHGVQGEDDP